MKYKKRSQRILKMDTVKKAKTKAKEEKYFNLLNNTEELTFVTIYQEFMKSQWYYISRHKDDVQDVIMNKFFSSIAPRIIIGLKTGEISMNPGDEKYFARRFRYDVSREVWNVKHARISKETVYVDDTYQNMVELSGNNTEAIVELNEVKDKLKYMKYGDTLLEYAKGYTLEELAKKSNITNQAVSRRILNVQQKLKSIYG